MKFIDEFESNLSNLRDDLYKLGYQDDDEITIQIVLEGIDFCAYFDTISRSVVYDVKTAASYDKDMFLNDIGTSYHKSNLFILNPDYIVMGVWQKSKRIVTVTDIFDKSKGTFVAPDQLQGLCSYYGYNQCPFEFNGKLSTFLNDRSIWPKSTFVIKHNTQRPYLAECSQNVKVNV